MPLNMEFRLLDTGKSSAAMNMAIDEAIMSNGVPTLRFYGWNPPAVTIGYFQGIEQEVDLEACKKLGVDVIRRLTGGGAVFHDKELTYSLIVSEDSDISRNILESYGQICEFIILGLRKLGLEAEFHPINDILIGGRKVSGNAQTRKGGMVLQHGTIILDADVKKMFSILKVPDEKTRDKLISTVENRITSLSRELGRDVGFKEVKEALIWGFGQDSALKQSRSDVQAKGLHSHMRVLKQGELFKKELARAQELSKTKYSTREWNFMR